MGDFNDTTCGNKTVEKSRTPIENSDSKPVVSLYNLRDDRDRKYDVFEQISRDKGEFVKDKKGRFRIVYPDDDDIDEYRTCIKHETMICDSYSIEFRVRLEAFFNGVEEQKKKRYPYSLSRNPSTAERLRVSKSNRYREGKEFKAIRAKAGTPLYKHLAENSAVQLVKDMVTGFIHICKTNSMYKFRKEEVQALVELPSIAPEFYCVTRNGEKINVHMEFITGSRLDIVSNFILNEHIWPLCLNIFSQILDAIWRLMLKGFSHCDIHSKNIIIEVVKEGTLRIRLIDYGEASQYTLFGLMKDIQSLVACLLALFTRNDFDPYDDDPETWIENNPEVWKEYPRLWELLKAGLKVQNGDQMKKLIEYISLLIGQLGTSNYERSLREIGALLKKESIPLAEF